jgi:hypothetical protein
MGRIPSVLPNNRLGHDSHDADMLCSRVCGSISKKYLAGHRGPFCCKQRIPDPRARDCPLLSPRRQVCPHLEVPAKSAYRQARFLLDVNRAFLELIPSTFGVYEPPVGRWF